MSARPGGAPASTGGGGPPASTGGGGGAPASTGGGGGAPASTGGGGAPASTGGGGAPASTGGGMLSLQAPSVLGTGPLHVPVPPRCSDRPVPSAAVPSSRTPMSVDVSPAAGPLVAGMVP